MAVPDSRSASHTILVPAGVPQQPQQEAKQSRFSFRPLPSLAVSACYHARDSTQHALQQLIADRVFMDGLGNMQLYI